MHIAGRWVRSVEKHLRDVPRGADVVVAVRLAPAHRSRLIEIGFTPSLTFGERVLPARVGNRSRENSEGVVEIHRDRPMETVYHQIEWEWTEFHGRQRVRQSDTRDVSHLRYPRTVRRPPAIELEIVEAPDGGKLVVAPAIANTLPNGQELQFAINLFLEIFGECETVRPDTTPFTRVPMTRLNWEILPPGASPWAAVKKSVASVLDGMGERKRPVAERRIRLLTKEFVPDQTAVGRAGFSGYLIFLYDAAGLSIVESLEYGNATYVFGKDWEALTQLTKAELIAGSLYEQRLIHRRGWEDDIRVLLR